jgi:hypothetical protein
MTTLRPNRAKDNAQTVNIILLKKVRNLISAWIVFFPISKIGRRGQSSGISIQTKENLMITKSHQRLAGLTGSPNPPLIMSMSRQALSVSTANTTICRRSPVKNWRRWRYSKSIKIRNSKIICFPPPQERALTLARVLI